MQDKRKRSMAERKIQAEVQLSEKAKVQERLLALEAWRRSQGNNTADQEEVRSFTVCTMCILLTSVVEFERAELIKFTLF